MLMLNHLSLTLLDVLFAIVIGFSLYLTLSALHDLIMMRKHRQKLRRERDRRK